MMPRIQTGTYEEGKPQITQITQIFFLRVPSPLCPLFTLWLINFKRGD